MCKCKVTVTNSACRLTSDRCTVHPPHRANPVQLYCSVQHYSTLQRSPYEHACITASHTMSEQVENAENDDADDAFQTPKYWDAFYDDEEVYDWYSAAGAMYAACRRELRRLKGRGRVLDVGCGTASHLAALAKYADVTGVDFSETWINANKARQEGVTYLVEDASSLSSLRCFLRRRAFDKGPRSLCLGAGRRSRGGRFCAVCSASSMTAESTCACRSAAWSVLPVTTGAAKRAKPDVAGATSDERDARKRKVGLRWMAPSIFYRSSPSQQKHLARCVPAGRRRGALRAAGGRRRGRRRRGLRRRT